MKFWELTLVMILFQVFGTALINTGVFTKMGFTYEPLTMTNPSQAEMEEAEEKLRSSTSDYLSSNDPASALFGIVSEMTIKLLVFFTPFKKYILFPAIIMQIFGIPAPISSAFTFVYYIMFLIGLYQLLSGKSFKEVE